MGKYVKEPGQAQGRDDKGRKHFKKGKTPAGRRSHSLIILAIFLWAATNTWAVDFHVAVEKNLFSPDRRYEPYFPAKKGGIHQDILKRSLILRGTLLKGKQRLAVIEVLPAARRELGLEDTKKRRFVVSQGDNLGDCQVLEIRPEEVILGGRCQGLALTLEDSPERKQPVSSQKVSAQGLRPSRMPKTLGKRPPLRSPHPKLRRPLGPHGRPFAPGKPPVE